MLFSVRTLAVLLLLLLPCFAMQPAEARPAKSKKRPPPVVLLALNTKETFTLRPDEQGGFSKRALRGWNRFLRCHHTGRSHTMSTRLAKLLYETGRHFAGRIQIVAGYRAPRVAREKGNSKSPHKRGLAADFRVEGVSTTALRDFVRARFAKVGVGYYPNSDFVHLDVRQKMSAFWIDYSGPGERARYSEDPDDDVRAERIHSVGGEPRTEPEVGDVAPKRAPQPSPTAGIN
jgi:uncharacterized protein YcbK (DUF882 family)